MGRFFSFEGVVTALITPFKGHQIDEEGLARNVDYQIEQGVHGLLPLGCTGEASTLSTEEKERVISIVVKQAKGKVPVWVGTGQNCTKETIESTKKAKDLGADAACVILPYYNKPTQEGIYRHFQAIVKSVDLPIVIYNNPGRTSVNLEPSTLAKVAKLPRIIGIKESTGNLCQTGDMLAATKNIPHFFLVSGDDIFTLPMMSLGAKGVISVLSNLIPKQIVELVEAAGKGELKKAQEIHFSLLPLFKAAFIEVNPVPIKEAMQLSGMAAGGCRLPLCEMSLENKEKLRHVLCEMQLI